MDGSKNRITSAEAHEQELLDTFFALLREEEQAQSVPTASVKRRTVMDGGIPAGGLRDLPKTKKDLENKLYDRLAEAQEQRITELQQRLASEAALYERLLQEKQRTHEVAVCAAVKAERLDRFEKAEAAQLKREADSREAWGTGMKFFGLVFCMMLERWPTIDFDEADQLTELFTSGMEERETQLFVSACRAVVASACHLLDWEPPPGPTPDGTPSESPREANQPRDASESERTETEISKDEFYELLNRYQRLLKTRREAFEKIVGPFVDRLRRELPVGERGVTYAREMLPKMKLAAFSGMTIAGSASAISEALIEKSGTLAFDALELIRRIAPWLIEQQRGFEYTVRLDLLWERALEAYR